MPGITPIRLESLPRPPQVEEAAWEDPVAVAHPEFR